MQGIDEKTASSSGEDSVDESEGTITQKVTTKIFFKSIDYQLYLKNINI